MIRTRNRLLLCRALLIGIICFIWGNSLLPAKVSAAFSNWVAQIIALLFSGGGPITEGTGLLRKIAHFTEFAALGACLTWHCGMLGKGKLPALLTGVSVACADEMIQRFVPGRGPALFDVCIDTLGVSAGIILLSLGHCLIQKNKNHSIGGNTI